MSNLSWYERVKFILSYTLFFVVIILLLLFLFESCLASELNLNPILYNKGDTVEQDQIIGLTKYDWSKVLDKINKLEQINLALEEQISNYKTINTLQNETLQYSDDKFKLQEDNFVLMMQERDMYRDNLDQCNSKVLSILKFNSYKTGFSFTLGVSTAILAGYIFNEIAK